MEPSMYQDIANVEDRHWWFVGRRRIVANVIGRLALPANAALLEIGCGSGGNLDMLKKFGLVSAVEMNESARIHATKAHGINVKQGQLPGDIPFPAGAFDLAVVLDVLEHVREDSESVAAIRELLRPGGWLVVTVPAFMALWSKHDEMARHVRRYRRRQLDGLIRRAGFDVIFSSYFNFFLFPIVAMVRLLQRATESNIGGLDTPPRLVNALLTGLFAFERFLLLYASLPFGVSLLVVARSPR